MSTRSTSASEQRQQAAEDIKRGAHELGQQAQERMSELGEAARLGFPAAEGRRPLTRCARPSSTTAR